MRRYIIFLFFLLSSFGYKAYSQCTGTPITGFTVTNTVNVSCYGGTDGEIEVTLAGGEAPFTYSLVLETGSGDIPIANIPNTNLQTVTFNNLFSNSAIGSYKVTVVTSNGTSGVPPIFICARRVITNLDVTQPDELLSTASVTQACTGNDGEILLSTNGGTPAYTYAWTGPVAIGNTNNPTGLIPGTYDVVITDALGCTFSDSFVLSGPPDATITPAGPFCASDAAVNLTAATPGGTWSGTGITDATAGTFDPVTAGAGSHIISYSVTVSGCTSIGTTTIVVNPAPDATITPAGPFCLSDAAVNLSAATPGGTWSGIGITDATAGTFDPATAGAGSHIISYSVTVLGCTSIGTTTIVVNPLPDATITPAGPFCISDAAVNLTAATPGGIWSGTGITDATAGTFDPATAGAGSHIISYSVTELGCTSIGTETIVVNPIPTTPTATNSGPVCENEDIQLSTPAVPGATYSWSGPNGYSSTLQEPIISGIALSEAGTYSVTVSLGGCESLSASTIVTVNPIPPAITITGPANPACQAASQDYSVTGQVNSIYSWTVPLGATIIGAVDGPTITVDFGLNSGDITVVEIADGGTGCSGLVSTLTVTLQPCPFTADFITDTDETCIGGTVIFTNASSAPIGTNYSWDFGTGATPATANTEGPHSVIYNTGGISIPTLTITDGIETSSTSKNITVSDPPTAVLTGGETICPGGTAPLTVTLTGTSPWNFVYNDGSLDNDTIFNIPTSPFVFGVSPLVNTTYTAVSVYNTCSNAASGSAVVNVSPAKDVTVSVDSVSGAPNDLVKVPISVTGYQDMLTMQFTVSWNTALLSFNSIQDFNLSGANAGFNLNNINSGFLTFSWFPENSSDTTIANGADIFSVAFDIQNTLCSDAPVIVDSSVTPIEFGDSNGCIANVITEGGNVEIQAAPQILSSIANPICFGDTVVFSATSGGMSNYDFYLNGVSVQNGANGLYVNHDLINLDSINVLLTDPQGCILPAQGIVMDVNQFTVTPTISDITSCGGMDGSISLSVSGGSSGYSFFWTGSAIVDASLQDQANLSSGFYSVLVTDLVNGCTQNLDFQLSDPVNFTVNVSQTNVSVTGGNDGSITLDIVGAGGPYDVSWIGPNSFTSINQNITNLFAGTYNAKIRDQVDGCIYILSVEITQPVNAIILNAVKTDVTTCGAMDGTINLIISGGSGSFAVSWIGPNSFTANSQNILGLEGGLYIATVLDLVTGITAQWTVQVGEPASFSINDQVTDISYCSGADGAISLTVTGGSGNFSYLWSDLSGLGFTSTDEDITDLALGTYRVVVTDNVSGCVDSLDAEVNRPTICDQPCALYVESTTNNTSCPDTDDGVAVINIISGGSGPGNYYVSLDTGKTFVPFLGQDITAITGNGQGSYLYIAKDTVTGCLDTTIANVGVSTNLMANIAVTNPGCAEDDGIITFNVSGGVVPFEVEIIDSVGNVTQKSGTGFFQFTGLTAGDYFYSVREQSGCTIVASDSIQLQVICESGCTSLTASAHDFQDATCATDPDGKAVIDVKGGSSPYEYTVDGVNWIPFISGNVVGGLPPNGAYNIAVRQDELNASCRTTVSVIINGPPPIVQNSPILTVQEASCNIDDGSVKISKVSGGTTPYQYKMDDSYFVMASDSIYVGLGAGQHIFSVVDALNCQADFDFEVDSPGVIVATATEVPVSCTSIELKAGIRIVIDLDQTTLPGPYEAYIATTSAPDAGIIYQIPDNGIRTILNLEKDFYNVTINSGVPGACSFAETLSVFGGAYPLDFEILNYDSIVSCIGGEGSITIGDVTGDPAVPYIVQLIGEGNTILQTYQLNYFDFENGGFTINSSNTNKLVAGDYYIKMIQNQETCPNVTAISGLITIYEPLGQLGFEVLDDKVSVSDIPTGSLLGEVIPSGGTPYEALIQLIKPEFEMNITDIIDFNDKQDWKTASSSGGNINKYLVEFDSLWAGEYEIFVQDSYGCEIRLEYNIGYDATVFIPNIFTPNNDGYNDRFYIRNLPESGTKVTITDRNGSVVFQSNNYTYETLWDGGDHVDAVYYYFVSMPNGDTFKGWVEKWAGTLHGSHKQ